LSPKERSILLGVLAAIFLLVGGDILNDSREGVVYWHLLLEGAIGLMALLGMFTLLRESFRLKKSLRETASEFSDYRKEAERWRSEYKKYVQGLSFAIDDQLVRWGLTVAEKEVAFLLLKGLSSKEIAEVRNTTEKTARVQSMGIYAKSGLANRSELSAFFLEDLLVPQNVGGEKSGNAKG
jgi:DNA-binding CsgD family transcriptional regulator